jgi:hypothetical protein
MQDTDFEQFCERRNLLTDAGYFDRWRALWQKHGIRVAWEMVETEMHEAFGVRRFLSYEAFHEAMKRSTKDAAAGRKRTCMRVYSE